jgi:hypothetical protein
VAGREAISSSAPHRSPGGIVFVVGNSTLRLISFDNHHWFWRTSELSRGARDAQPARELARDLPVLGSSIWRIRCAVKQNPVTGSRRPAERPSIAVASSALFAEGRSVLVVREMCSLRSAPITVGSVDWVARRLREPSGFAVWRCRRSGAESVRVLECLRGGPVDASLLERRVVGPGE